MCKTNYFNYSVNITKFMPRMHKKVPGTTLHKRPTLPETKRSIVLLGAGHVSQPYSKLFLIEELKMLTMIS